MTASRRSRLPDARPYPTDPVKNELLIYATQLANGGGKAQTALAHESLHNAIAAMLLQKNYLGLSVALAMSPNAAVYAELWRGLQAVLNAYDDTQMQWFALPVVLVCGATQDTELPDTVPQAAIDSVFGDAKVYCLPKLLSAETLSSINAGQWFAAKQNREQAEQFAQTLVSGSLKVAAGQSVCVVYAVGFGDKTIQAVLSKPLNDAALPLMQVWQQHFSGSGITLFANPLPPMTPMTALYEGSNMRARMACDVFTANTVRAIRLQNPSVSAVIAVEAGGRLLFGFDAVDAAFSFEPQVFARQLSPMDNIDSFIQNFLDLLVECRVEYVRLLEDVLAENAAFPSYAQARQMKGCNPLLEL
ncbi:hypothetical protein [Stenoxybacter acetivorans]|uniref:hypothetical protein n=1 Tax=Stenoxybacter acetivorans TaxID=422441 RepID=UPI000564E4EF|nr:hypothetical protein [Stenoxybacter acetivorans]